MKLLGYPRALRRSLKLERHSSKVVCEEFVLRSLVASPLIKPRFTPGGWQEVRPLKTKDCDRPTRTPLVSCDSDAFKP